jgi:hypothetical protein
MRDLRDRLERRSERFDLPAGALDRTIARGARRRVRRRIATGAVALAVAAAGIAIAVTALPGAPRSPGANATPSVAATRVPDGVYWTAPLSRPTIESTLADAGFSRGEARRYYFRRALPFTRWIEQGLVVQDGFWFQTARSDSGEREAGWSGSFRVVARGRIEARGYGCTISYAFSLAGRTLSLDVLDETGTGPECGPGDLVAQTAIFESAPFVRTR